MKEDTTLAPAEMSLSRSLAALSSTTLYPVYRLKESVMPARSVPVLYYHRVNPGVREAVRPESFEEQIRWLKLHDYNLISLGEYCGNRHQPRFWQQRNVVVTFDDGYEDNYLYAFPILARYGGICTVFVATCYAERGSSLAGDSARAGGQDSRMLSWKQIEEMSACGVEFGSHTVSHVDLTRLAGDELRRELVESRETIRAHTGQPVAFLSYPFGRYNRRVVKAAAEAGYHGACSTLYGRNSRHTPPFELKRLRVSTTACDSFEFDKRMIGAFDIPMYLFEWLSNYNGRAFGGYR